MIQRKPTAIAIAASALVLVATGAQAQSGIKISGLVDVGVYEGFDGVKNVGTIQRSNIAFTGTEDLGGGMAATFALSHRFDIDTGTNELQGKKPFWHGESTVGLKGRFGHVRLGRALDVVYAQDWAYDPWYNFDRIASPAWQMWHYNYATSRTSNNGSAEYGRLSNGVFYDSPDMAGFTVHLSGAFEDDNAIGAGTGNNAGISINYAKNGIDGMLATSRNSSGDTVQFVGGKVQLGAWGLMAAYDRSVYKAAVKSVAKAYTFGTTYAVGSMEYKASYGHQDLDGASNGFIGLGASHAMSKRTRVYVSLGHRLPEVGSDETAYGLGIAHSF